MDYQDRRRYYNRCKPHEPLDPLDPRFVDIDAFEVDGERPRGPDWAIAMAQQFLLDDAPACRFVTGLPGSGKTTDLRRLAAHLHEDGTGKLLPVIVEAGDYFDLNATIDIPDLLAAIVHATEQAVCAMPTKASSPGVVERLWTWLTATDVELDALRADVGPLQMSAKLKDREDLRARLRRGVSSRLAEFVGEVRRSMAELDRVAQDRGYGGILVIVDSLEKLRGTSTTWQAVTDSAERVFVRHAQELALGVHVLYAVPMALLWRMTEVEVVPMIKLHEREGSLDDPLLPAGLAAARAIVRARIDEAGLEALFGRDWQGRVDRLIRLSGGYPRDLVQLLQTAVAEVRDAPLTEEQVEVACGRFAGTKQRMVARDDIPLLAEIARDRVARVDRGRLAALDDLVRTQVILAYHNRQPWFDVHPAVRSLLS